MSMNLQTKKNKTKKPALGRGLGSLLGENRGINPTRASVEDDVSSTLRKERGGEATKEPSAIPEKDRIWSIPIDKLIANEGQPRKVFDKKALQSLSDSIREKGILQPIIARRLSQDEFEIIAGERRWRAAQSAGLHEVPVILKRVDDQNTLELALIENIQREDLNSIEEAEAYRFLIDEYGLTQEELGRRVGKDRASVSNTMRLLNLGPLVREMVSDSRLSKGQAKLLVTITDKELQLEIAEKIVSEQMSVRAAEKFIAKTMKRESTKVEEPVDRTSLALIKNVSEELQKVLGTKVSIDYRKGKGQISISYYSDEEFNYLVGQLREI